LLPLLTFVWLGYLAKSTGEIFNPWLWEQAFSSLKQDEQNASSKEDAKWK
jgi:hypothetical protein